jgi:Tol biopolymer transport system component
VGYGLGGQQWPGFAVYVPSPNQKWAALAGNKSNETEIDLVPEAGGERQLIAFGGFNPTWSPDSKYLAFSNFDQHYIWLHVFDMADGADHRLLTTGDPGVPVLPPKSILTNVIPTWSPTGDRLALTVNWTQFGQPAGWLGLIRPDGSDFQIAVPPTSDALPFAAAFSADGRYLAVALGSSYRPQGVAIYSAAGGNRLRVVPDAAIAGWSPSGHILAVTNVDGISLLREPGNADAVLEVFGPAGCNGVAWKPK